MICVHFGLCGGCSRQDKPYLEQIAQKERAVKTQLSKLEIGQFLPILPSPDLFFYRNKMEYSFGDERDVAILSGTLTQPSPVPGEGNNNIPSPLGERARVRDVHLGLHPKGRYALVTPTPECLLQSEASQRILEIVSRWATERRVPVYLRKDNSGVLRHVVVREGKNTGERLVNLYSTSALAEDSVEELADGLRSSAIRISTFLWTVNDGISDVAQGTLRPPFWGEGHIYERVHNVTLKVTPTSFMQTNTRASENMIRLLSEWIIEDREKAVIPAKAGIQSYHSVEKRLQLDSRFRGNDNVLIDLYCGAGTIGLNLMERFERLIGVESNEQAVEDARANAVYNGILKAEFMAGRAEDLVGAIKSAVRNEPITMIVDPPRAGLHARVIQLLLDLMPERLYYVSCNPESLARDLAILNKVYVIAKVRPMDFFPHTDHVETMVVLFRRG